MHSLPTGRILKIYFAPNERKSHVNFCQNGRKSCLHIYEAGGDTIPAATDHSSAFISTICRYLHEHGYRNVLPTNTHMLTYDDKKDMFNGLNSIKQMILNVQRLQMKFHFNVFVTLFVVGQNI